MYLEIKPIAPPLELLELADKDVLEIQPLEFELGTTNIQTRDRPKGELKNIQVLRLWYDKDPTVAGLDYWDITSTTLIAQLYDTLKDGIAKKLSLRITAFGERPKKRFTIQWYETSS